MKILKSIERSAKKVFLRFAKSLIKSEPVDLQEINPAIIRRILIVHLDRKVGNIVLSTAMIEKTKKTFLNADVDIIIASPVKVIVDDNPYLKNIYEFHHSDYIKNPLKLLSLKRFLINQQYDLAIESSNPSGTSSLNGFITYLAKAKYRVGFNVGNGALYTNIHIAPDKKDHYFISKQKLISVFSEDKSILLPKIFYNQEISSQLKNDLISKYKVESNKNFVGIWIGARDKKKWEIENFFSIYNYLLISTNYFPILMFGIEETDEFNKIDKEKYISIYFNDLRNLKDFLSCLEIFISGDTGPLHYAYALGINTIGIFLQDNFCTYGYSVKGKNFIISPKETNKMTNEVVDICKILENKN